MTSGDFRTVMGQFATGVTVVTALADGRPQGITLNAISSVSLEPPLIVIALDRRRFIVPAIEATGRFAVNILAEDQQPLSDCFAGASVTPDRDAFCGAGWRPGVSGMPLLDGSIGSMECAVVDRVSAGDHWLYVARVESLSVEDDAKPPLLYHRRRYLRIERATAVAVQGRQEGPREPGETT
jgi:3-hydroxy-9,10-secoandrosta-1,3,5(10)-triene-9,17-dione monooxygenase reductase component